MSTVIAKIGRTRYKTELSNGPHVLIADEPEPDGSDLGPTPYDYLLMSLGSCIAMTLRMYADRKQWPLESVEIQLRQEREYREDCMSCDQPSGHIHVIYKHISLHGKLDEKQQQRLLEISDKCPVSKTLSQHIEIRFEMDNQ